MMFLILACFSAQFAQAARIDADGILRLENGNAQKMLWQDAVKACPQGTHLPSLREQLTGFETHGSRIIEAGNALECPLGGGFGMIESIEKNGGYDGFCYSRAGYQAQHGDLGTLSFWTSSSPRDSNYKGFAWLVFGKDGLVGGDTNNYGTQAVQCFRN